MDLTSESTATAVIESFAQTANRADFHEVDDAEQARQDGVMTCRTDSPREPA
jgi:hypothetical protein